MSRGPSIFLDKSRRGREDRRSKGLCSQGSVTVESSNTEVDPFAELEDEFTADENLAKETRGNSAVSMRETVDGCLIHQFASNFQTTGRTRSFEK